MKINKALWVSCDNNALGEKCCKALLGWSAVLEHLLKNL